MLFRSLSEEVQDTMRFDPDPFGFNTLRYITDISESKALNHKEDPCIIISASDMLEAGRIKHHVANHISDPRCTILIVGYCEPTALGARIQQPGLQWISIFGLDRRIKAQITKIESFSGRIRYSAYLSFMAPKKPQRRIRDTCTTRDSGILRCRNMEKR